MLADEITAQLRALRAAAVAEAGASGHAVTRALVAKGVAYGSITANPAASRSAVERAMLSGRADGAAARASAITA